MEVGMNLAELYDVQALHRAALTQRQRPLVELLVNAGRLTYCTGNKLLRIRDPRPFGVWIRLLASERALAEFAAQIKIAQLSEEYLFLQTLLQADYKRVCDMIRPRPRTKLKYRMAHAALEVIHACVSNETGANLSAFAHEGLTRLEALIDKYGLAAGVRTLVADCIRVQPASVRRGSPLGDRLRKRHREEVAEAFSEAIAATHPSKELERTLLSSLSIEDRTRRQRIARVARYIQSRVRRIRRRIAICYTVAVVDRKLPFSKLRDIVDRITNPPEGKFPIRQPWRYFVKRLKLDFSGAQLGVYRRRTVIRALEAKYQGHIAQASLYEIIGAMGVWQNSVPRLSVGS
jgi:hypothetical protein